MSGFVHKQVVSFDEGDPAGISFFANAYVYAHRAYEAFMRAKGFHDFFLGGDVIAPFVHTECDHLSPMRPGDELTVHVSVEKLGTSSMTFLYEINGASGTKHATVRMVSVFVDKQTFQKMPVPQNFRDVLESLT